MLELFLAILLALSCPSQPDSNHCDNSGQVSTLDTGGEAGHIPPRPPKP